QIQRYKKYWDLVSQGEYYRLSGPFGAGPYTAWSHVSGDKKRALVSLVTGPTCAAPPFQTLRLRGLDPDVRYRINGEASYPGHVLMQAGYPLPMRYGHYQPLQLYLEAEE